jgi:hypothetical protein
VIQGPFHFGHIQYQIKLVLPNGSEVDVGIPPLDIDFTVVNGGFEILGTPNALPGVTGAAVPRMSCRLVRIKSQVKRPPESPDTISHLS